MVINFSLSVVQKILKMGQIKKLYALAILLIASPIALGQSNSTSDFDLPSSILFEVSSLALQLGKLNRWIHFDRPDFPLPTPLAWNIDKEECYIDGRCDRIHEQITLGGEAGEDGGSYPTALYGAQDNTVELSFGMRNFSYALTIPNLSFVSTDFVRTKTNLNTSTSIVHSYLNVSIANTRVGIAGDFDFDVTKNAFQVSHVDVTLDLGRLSILVPNVMSFDGNQWSPLPPVDKDAGPEVMSQWRARNEEGLTLENRYEKYLEDAVNSVLAN